MHMHMQNSTNPIYDYYQTNTTYDQLWVVRVKQFTMPAAWWTWSYSKDTNGRVFETNLTVTTFNSPLTKPAGLQLYLSLEYSHISSHLKRFRKHTTWLDSNSLGQG